MSPAPARSSPQFPTAIEVEGGPWNTNDDSLDVAHAGPNIARRLENVYSLDGGSTVGRPGIVVQGAAAPTTAIQAHGQLTLASGTQITYRITNGVIQTQNKTTLAWTTVVTGPNFATAVITIDTTHVCQALPFAGLLVVSDQTNVPWTWNGVAGAGGLTPLTEAAVWWWFWIKDGCIVAIKNADRRTIQWSKPNTPNDGYAGDSYEWTLAQTDESPLTAGIGLNDSNVIFRARSCQTIMGSVTATYSATTSSTRAGLSETVGTSSPFSLVENDGWVYFLDSDGRPQAVTARSGPNQTLISTGPDQTPMWHRLRNTLSAVDLTKLANFTGVFFAPLNLVLLGVQTISATTNPNVWIVIDPTRKEPIAVWTGFEFTVPAMVLNLTLQPTLMFSANADGYSYVYGDPIQGPFDDGLHAGTVAVTHTIEATALTHERNTEVDWDQLTITLGPDTNQTLALSARTPYGTRAAIPLYVAGASSLWDVASWDVDSWSSDAYEVKRTVGLGQTGRWIAPILTHSMLSEQFHVTGVAVSGCASTDNPQVR